MMDWHAILHIQKDKHEKEFTIGFGVDGGFSRSRRYSGQRRF
jgi:hypothetical protein